MPSIKIAQLSVIFSIKRNLWHQSYFQQLLRTDLLIKNISLAFNYNVLTNLIFNIDRNFWEINLISLMQVLIDLLLMLALISVTMQLMN